jgi:signal transduction histidine kinase
MTLTTRLSAFFLAALAAVLIGFSGAIFLLVRADLGHRLDARLRSGLDTLEASIDVEAEGLEWEPADRRLGIGTGDASDDIRYAIRDGEGRVLDLSPNAEGSRFPAHWLPAAWPVEPPDGIVLGRSEGWRLAARRIRLADLSVRRSIDPDPDQDDDIVVPVMILTAGIEPTPVESSLRHLAWMLWATSLAAWLVAASVGRRLARRALEPLSQMARASREMSAIDDPARLPEPSTRDELADLARAFNALLDRRQEAFDRQRHLAAEASHQLRTPLAGLIAEVDVTRRRPRSALDYETSLDRVRRDARRLQQIVESLLLLSRPDDPLDRPDPTPIDLDRWLPTVLDPWSDHPRRGDLVLDLHESVQMLSQPTLLGQLLGNLIDNALKYSPPGSPVTIAARREGAQAAISVQDRGPGLDPVEQSHLFDPFYRSPRARQTGAPGVGLGLAVAARIAARLGATIDVESSPGQGTRFILRLPSGAAHRLPPGPVSTDLT